MQPTLGTHLGDQPIGELTSNQSDRRKRRWLKTNLAVVDGCARAYAFKRRFRRAPEPRYLYGFQAIERLKVRPRNEGAVCGGALHCQFPHFQPMLGYAATGRMRCTSAPVYGRAYHENMNWWRYVASIPEPRI